MAGKVGDARWDTAAINNDMLSDQGKNTKCDRNRVAAGVINPTGQDTRVIEMDDALDAYPPSGNVSMWDVKGEK